MTTTPAKTDRDEVIAKALADLEALRRLDICDPLELTRPFRQWTAHLNTIGETLRDVGFAATIDAEVRRSVENILEEMSAAASLVEHPLDRQLGRCRVRTS